MANDDDWVPRFVDAGSIQEGIDTADDNAIKTAEEIAEVGDEDAVAIAVAASKIRTEDDDA